MLYRFCYTPLNRFLVFRSKTCADVPNFDTKVPKFDNPQAANAVYTLFPPTHNALPLLQLLVLSYKTGLATNANCYLNLSCRQSSRNHSNENTFIRVYLYR